ncbi:MAG: 23S rRNA (guanosine(2251)-2'-O)-methyltransferase RlmB [Selenomonadaceae bacterium]|nr:23S rRNA (guanosine(2251)-2'-O)-methyltransferase RlmB [Selenomonadaceae bacterium]
MKKHDEGRVRSRRPKDRDKETRRQDENERQKRRPNGHGRSVENESENELLVGRNAVTEALRAGRGINRVLLVPGDRKAAELEDLAREHNVPVEHVKRERIEALAGGMRHQGVLAWAAPVPYATLEDILHRAEEKGEPPFLVLLDELEDPHNLGALLRTADATGVHGILIPKRRSVPLNATVAKTSAGAVEYVPVARIGNIVQTLKALKAKGFWVAGADMDGAQNYWEADLTGPLVLVVGSEGHGMTRLTKENCDFIVRMPMVGQINSLNASVAGSILMYESMRQRLLKKKA